MNEYKGEHFLSWVSKNYYDLREIEPKEILEKYNTEFPANTFVLDSFKETCGGCPMVWEGKSIKGEDICIRVRHGGLSIRFTYQIDTIFSCDVDSYGIDGVCSFNEAIEIIEKESNNEIKFI